MPVQVSFPWQNVPGKPVQAFAEWDHLAADKKASFKAIIETYGGAVPIYVPPGTYNCVFSTTAIDAPSGTRLFGAGDATLINVTGFDPTNGSGTGYQIFGKYPSNGLASASTNLHFARMKFKGERTGATRYVNKQAAVFNFYGSYAAIGGFALQYPPFSNKGAMNGITIEDCTFEDLWGFPAQIFGYEYGTTYRHNRHLRCDNGVNINSLLADVHDNFVEDGEGIECGGLYVTVTNNRIVNFYNTAISVNNAPGTVANSMALVASNRAVKGQVGGAGATETAIIVSTGFGNTQVIGNGVAYSYGAAFQVGYNYTGSGFGGNKRVIVAHNQAINPGHFSATAGSQIGYYIAGEADGAELIGNIAEIVDPGAWAATTAYTFSQVRRPTSANRNGHVYAVRTAGTSGGAEPTWPTTANGTVTDGTVTWIEVEGDWRPATAFNIQAPNVVMDLNQVVGSGWSYAGFRFSDAGTGTHPTNTYFGPGNQYDNSWASAIKLDDASATFRDGSVIRYGAAGLTKPAASATYRGVRAIVRGGAGVADTDEICRKDAADAYAWRSIY